MRISVHTFVNDPKLYGAMRASMQEAGFDRSDVEFFVYDNSGANLHDPYACLGSVLGECRDSYVVFCHQDLLFNEWTSFGQLCRCVEEITRLDPSWAVLGTAGRGHRGEWRIHLDDPGGRARVSDTPCMVQTLDENFLLFNPQARIRPTPELSGFHFYGSDCCLNAQIAGRSAYVINFPVLHLSAGDTHSSGFRTAAAAFEQAWRARLHWGLIYTTTIDFEFAASPAIERIIRLPRVRGLLRRIRLNILPSRAVGVIA